MLGVPLMTCDPRDCYWQFESDVYDNIIGDYKLNPENYIWRPCTNSGWYE